MEQFRSVMHEGNLYDLGWKWEKFTWSNSHGDDSFTKERLDRAMTNSVWSTLYKDTWVEVLAARTSDHKPLLMHILKLKGKRWERKRWFKYEAGWALEEECERIIKEVWEKKVTAAPQASSVMGLL
ncbi:hypothetical protein F2P56_027262 [Juglans regia]|uniref:Uncharacterized protein n=2 Tax=Juglans regia TaxID=51240 RepID=A0A833TQ72_JUGRE|nr:uncharacterized protein LOC108994730 [Juglans regia]KAF5452240.1 hypothetical protein F2P56_027262 [Juglans regia]